MFSLAEKVYHQAKVYKKAFFILLINFFRRVGFSFRKMPKKKSNVVCGNLKLNNSQKKLMNKFFTLSLGFNFYDETPWKFGFRREEVKPQLPDDYFKRFTAYEPFQLLVKSFILCARVKTNCIVSYNWKILNMHCMFLCNFSRF